jgi:catechol 2,3-dioxygenase-like lactoylglutathione lyase family enzyme
MHRYGNIRSGEESQEYQKHGETTHQQPIRSGTKPGWIVTNAHHWNCVAAHIEPDGVTCQIHQKAYRFTTAPGDAMELNHTIVPAHDKEASARFFAQIFGLTYDGAVSHFAPVKVNQHLTMDFDNANDFRSHHYAFKVSESEFDEIFGRLKICSVEYGSQPWTPKDGELNDRHGGRGVYWLDPDGHMLEILTRDGTEK